MKKTIKVSVNKDQTTYTKGKDYDLPEELGKDWTEAGYCKPKKESSKGKGDE